ncbi:MAG: hypothetical protein QMD71_03560 [bacterium]|nr:hypothetical protein [bacterium]
MRVFRNGVSISTKLDIVRENAFFCLWDKGIGDFYKIHRIAGCNIAINKEV